MKIGIIGSGNIGGTLGKHWAKAGHEVMFSSRHPEDLETMAKQANALVGTIEEA
ncbi:MAG: NAD(P)-binding domain-containing protein, partial [Xenococcaceae cyanobacterium]